MKRTRILVTIIIAMMLCFSAGAAIAEKTDYHREPVAVDRTLRQ